MAKVMPKYSGVRPTISPAMKTVSTTKRIMPYMPVAARTALGTGDLAMPLMLAIAAYKVNLNFVLSFVIIIGALLGLILTMFILRKYKRALPAIPPLLFGIVVVMAAYFAVTML